MNRSSPALMLASLFLTCVAALPTTHAGDWEQRNDLGGWLDKETGLVWGQLPDEYYHLINPSYPVGGSWTWDGVVNIILPQYKQYTGLNDWRMPTRAEGSAAVSHGLVGTVIPSDSVFLSYGKIWTSEAGGRYAYYFSVLDGRTGSYSKTTGLNPGALLVRHSVPVASGPGKKPK